MAAAAIVALIRAPKVDGRWLQAPVGIYAGWLTAASFVSLGSTATGYAIALRSLEGANLAIISALGVTLAVIAHKHTAPEYGITVIWALIRIIVANLSGAVSVIILAAAGIIVVAGATWKARSPA